MKTLTQKDVDLMKALIAGDKVELESILRQLGRIQDKLHTCTTMQEIDAVEADYRELLNRGNELLKNITKMKRKIAKFYAPAQK